MFSCRDANIADTDVPNLRLRAANPQCESSLSRFGKSSMSVEIESVNLTLPPACGPQLASSNSSELSQQCAEWTLAGL